MISLNTIKSKLIAIIMITNLIVLTIVGVGFLYQERTRVNSEMIKNLTSLATIISDHSTAALSFGDEVVIKEMLSALRIKESILLSAIFDSSGNVVGSYENVKSSKFDLKEIAKHQESRFEGNYLYLYVPIFLNKDRVGTVFILSSLKEVNEMWYNFIYSWTLFSIFGLLLAFVIASYLQRIISKPIEHLKNTSNMIALSKNYNLRANKIGDDEFGELVDAFNLMISTVESQNGLIHQSEQKLKESNENLELRVKERTLEILNSNDKLQALANELERAKNMADLANKAKSQFLANMSHEIRTPINAVMGMHYLLEKTELTAQQKNYISKAQSSATTLLGIINDILDFSKIEAGKLSIEKIDFDFDKMLRDISNVLEFKANEKGLNLNIKRDVDIPNTLRGDPLRVEQVLLNLGNNAIKFTSNGAIDIAINSIFYIENSIRVKFCVQDSGIGMNLEQQKAIFQEFSQADSSKLQEDMEARV